MWRWQLFSREILFWGGNFRGQFSLEAIILGGNCPGGGGIMQGAIFLGVNCTRTIVYALSFKTDIFMPFACSFNAANQLM